MRLGVCLWGALALLASTFGCTANHLIFTTYTKLGLDVSTTNGEMVNGVFGYKRFEGAIVPVDLGATQPSDQQNTEPPNDPQHPAQPKDATNPKMPSVYAGVAVRNSWVKGLDLAQVFGTGSAAKHLASGEATGTIAEILALTKDGNTPPATPSTPPTPPANGGNQ